MRDFGLVNPAYAMANAMTAIGRLAVPAEPRTVYNVGVVEGGTSVNSIPFEVSMSIDLRSDGARELADLEKRFLVIPPAAANAENAARSTAKGAITAEAKLIGDRPVGSTPVDAPIVRTAVAAFQAAGVTPSFEAGSTDSNVPMSLGIPAVTLRSGFLAERIHSLEESLVLNRPETLKHMAVGLATVLALAGMSER
jgi:di/tripeptidase